MKKSIIFILLLLTIENKSLAAEYGHYDLKKTLTITKTEKSEKYGLNIQYIDKVINDLSNHARNYPPKFDNNNDKERAIKDLKILSNMLDTLTNTPKAQPALLRRSSLLNSIGHNLDIPGSAQKADRDFQNLLAQKPDDAAANFGYGVFLAGSNQSIRSLPYLEKAAIAGYTDAYFSLGMAYLTQKNTDLSIKNFEKYQKHNPNDKEASKIIEAIKSGNIKFE